MHEQWNRIRAEWSPGTRAIHSLRSLYIAELQELHSAEAQLGNLLDSLPAAFQHLQLARQIEGYRTETRSRRRHMHRILLAAEVDPREHSDQGMSALLLEFLKLAHIRSSPVRDAALLASLRRVIHFKIAAYGTLATYAQMLGRTEEASRFAECCDRDEEFDAELSATASTLVNPEAQTISQAEFAGAEAVGSPPH